MRGICASIGLPGQFTPPTEEAGEIALDHIHMRLTDLCKEVHRATGYEGFDVGDRWRLPLALTVQEMQVLRALLERAVAEFRDMPGDFSIYTASEFADLEEAHGAITKSTMTHRTA